MTNDPIISMLEVLENEFNREDSFGINVTKKQAKDLLDAIELLINQRDEAYSNTENLSISFRLECNEQVLTILMRAMNKDEKSKSGDVG